MKNFFRWIPSAITLCNLLMGCIAIKFALNDNLLDATYFIGIAMIFDFFDGFAARLLNATSEFGKEIDSLADMVSFGVAPAFIIYSLASPEHLDYSKWWLCSPQTLQYFSFAIALASAVRLANFNLDTRQTKSFIGLPTPANALFISSFPWMANSDSIWSEYITSPFCILFFIILCCWLPVSKIPFLSLKFKKLRSNDNLYKMIFVLIVVACTTISGSASSVYILFFYILISQLEKRYILSKQIPE